VLKFPFQDAGFNFRTESKIDCVCFFLCSAILVGACLAASSAARAQTAADIATYSGPDRTQKLIDGARKEGEVLLYSSAVVEDSDALAAAFQKKYGVTVKLWRASSEDILRRAVTEHRGGRDDVDVAETAGTEMEGLQREQLLQPMASPAFADLIPQAVAQNRAWVMSRLSIFTAAYNTNVVKPADVPKSYDDLTNPKWRDKLGVEADDGNWLMAVADAMGEDKALPLFRAIVAANGMSVRKGHTLLANLVVAGEVPLALTAYNYRVAELKGKGAPIDGVVLPPAIALPTGIAVFAHAPHPYAAALFMDFFLSDDGQRILLARGNVPTNRTVQAPPPGLNFVDVAKYLDDGDKWTKLFKQTFAGGVR
jgi:iron(III) transport system substrate-binding protein